MKKSVCVLFVFVQFLTVQAQEICDCPQMSEKGKGTLYLAFGYNRDFFTKSDIHFQNNTTDNYDFTLYGLEAEDRDGFSNLLHEDITVPQFSFRLGYFFNDKHDFGVEINYDHVKYVVVENQKTHLTGSIREKYYDQDTIFNKEFLTFEHTNGANYIMVNFIKRQRLFRTHDNKFWTSAIIKAGGGVVFPRSDVTIFGNEYNARYHVAGYVVGMEGGLRFDFLKNFFVEATMKGAYANYLNVYLYGDGKANHHFYSLEYILTIGAQIPCKIF